MYASKVDDIHDMQISPPESENQIGLNQKPGNAWCVIILYLQKCKILHLYTKGNYYKRGGIAWMTDEPHIIRKSRAG